MRAAKSVEHIAIVACISFGKLNIAIKGIRLCEMQLTLDFDTDSLSIDLVGVKPPDARPLNRYISFALPHRSPDDKVARFCKAETWSTLINKRLNPSAFLGLRTRSIVVCIQA
jgi:hypothetical protein